MCPHIHNIDQDTLPMVKFMKIIRYGCEIQILIVVVTLFAGFHILSTITLRSFPPAKATM